MSKKDRIMSWLAERLIKTTRLREESLYSSSTAKPRAETLQTRPINTHVP
jgi:hypothetical protein